MPRDPATHVSAVVKIDGVEIPCDADSLDPGILSGLKVTWGRNNRLEKAAASTCDFQLVDPDGGTTDYTQRVAYNSSVEVLAVAPAATRSRVFYGYVSDLKITHEPGGDAVITVTAIDPTARLSAVTVGDTPWPQQTPESRRRAILAAVPANTVSWPTLPNTLGIAAVAAKDVDNQSAWDVITDFLWGVGLAPWPVATGAIAGIVHTGTSSIRQWTVGITDTRANRRVPLADFLTIPVSSEDAGRPIPTVTLDACDVDLDGTEFQANPSDTAQVIRVTWEDSNGDSRTVVRGVSAASGDGTRVFDVQSGVTTEDDAQQVAQRWGSQMSWWSEDFEAPWGVGALRVDPDTVSAVDDFHLALVRLLEQTSRINHQILLQLLPTWTPWRDRTTAHAHEPNLVGFLQGGSYTFTDGRWLLDLQMSVESPLKSELAPPAPITVSPGDTINVAHDDPTVLAVPATRWAVGEVATFADGQYGWDGAAWVAGGVKAILASPGTELDVAHDDDRVRPIPATAWDEDEYATFTDGTWRWDGTAWTEWAPPPPVVVQPGASVDVAHDDPLVEPDPTTPWADDEYATFTDGTWRWDGTAWTAVIVPWPGEVFNVAHDDPLVILPGIPAARWPWDGTVSGTAAKFTDGVFAWRESAVNPQGYWAQVFRFLASTATTAPSWIPVPHDDPMVRAPMAAADGVVALFTDGPFEVDGTALAWVPTDRIGYDGATVPYTHDDPTVVAIPQVPWPTTTDEARGRPVPYVTFTDGTYRWDGAAWVPYLPPPRDTTWAGAPEGTAWNDVPAGTSWNDWTGEV